MKVMSLANYRRISEFYAESKPIGWTPRQYAHEQAETPVIQLFMYFGKIVYIRETTVKKWDVHIVPVGTPIYSSKETAERSAKGIRT